jgi:hypothetical protein
MSFTGPMAPKTFFWREDRPDIRLKEDFSLVRKKSLQMLKSRFSLEEVREAVFGSYGLPFFFY